MNDLSSQAFNIRNLIIELVLSYLPFPLATVRPRSPVRWGGDPTDFEYFLERTLRFSNSEVTDINKMVVAVFEVSTLNLTLCFFLSSKAVQPCRKHRHGVLRNPNPSLRILFSSNSTPSVFTSCVLTRKCNVPSPYVGAEVSLIFTVGSLFSLCFLVKIIIITTK